jgi:MFS family permease
MRHQSGSARSLPIVCASVASGHALVSSLGSWLLVIAIPAHILAATGSLRDTGLTLAAAYLPQLVLGPVAGAVADRWDRRRLMIAANLFCAGLSSANSLATAFLTLPQMPAIIIRRPPLAKPSSDP